MSRRAQWRSGRRLHNVYSLLYNAVRVRGDRSTRTARARAADDLGPRRLERHPALSDAMGRRSAVGLGRTRGQHPRRAVVRAVGRALLGDRRRRLLRRPAGAELFVRWTAASVFGSHFRFHGIGERGPWDFGERRSQVRWWLQLRSCLLPYLEFCCRQAAAGRHAGAARDAAGVSHDRTRASTSCNTCSATACWWRPSCAPAAMSTSTCGNATGMRGRRVVRLLDRRAAARADRFSLSRPAVESHAGVRALGNGRAAHPRP